MAGVGELCLFYLQVSRFNPAQMQTSLTWLSISLSSFLGFSPGGPKGMDSQEGSMGMSELPLAVLTRTSCWHSGQLPGAGGSCEHPCFSLQTLRISPWSLPPT